jgi:hypothetical protein
VWTPCCVLCAVLRVGGIKGAALHYAAACVENGYGIASASAAACLFCHQCEHVAPVLIQKQIEACSWKLPGWMKPCLSYAVPYMCPASPRSLQLLRDVEWPHVHMGASQLRPIGPGA